MYKTSQIFFGRTKAVLRCHSVNHLNQCVTEQYPLELDKAQSTWRSRNYGSIPTLLTCKPAEIELPAVQGLSDHTITRLTCVNGQ